MNLTSRAGRRVLAGVFLAVVAAFVPGPTSAAAASRAAIDGSQTVRLAGFPALLPVAARGGRSFGGGRSRARTPSAQRARRPINGRRVASSVLRALGIAYLFHLVFGIGDGGGSPIGLFIILGLVAFFVVRSRNRRRMHAAY